MGLTVTGVLLLRMIAVTSLAGLLTHSAVQAQEEIGRVEFEGDTLILFDDNSWARADDGAEASADIVEATPCPPGAGHESAVIPLSFCVDADGWERTEDFGDYEFLFQERFGIQYFGVIPERAPLSASFMRRALLTNAEMMSPDGSAEVRVVDEGQVKVDGELWNFLEYEVETDGVVFLFINYYATMKATGTVQFVFYSIGSAPPELRAFIADVLASIRFPA